MTANVVNLPIKIKLVCTECGASGQGSCRCDAPYVRPSKRAEAAIAENPTRSDRAIAEVVGVDHKTVAKARRATGDKSPVSKRTGKDGKIRKLPTKAQPAADDVPPQSRVNTMLRNLERAISPWVKDTEKWIASHVNDLANEKNEHGDTGKRCLAQALHAWADRLLQLAQALEIHHDTRSL